MKQFNGYAEAQEAAKAAGGEKLPAGIYECKILGVKYVVGEKGNSDMIAIQFDIAEGEYKDFFKNQYENSTLENKKYKGKTNIYVPSDDGSEKDGWTKNSFAKWTNAFEESNKDYKWDWDENKWKGLSVGIAFGETGTVIEGKEVVYTEPRYAVPVEKIATAKMPQFKAKNGYGQGKTTQSNDFMSINTTEETLPWD